MQAYVQFDGTVTIPQEVRDRIGLQAGDEVDVDVDSEGRVTLAKVAEDWAARNARLDPDRFKKMRGTLKSDLTTDEIMLQLRGERDDLPDRH